MEDAARSGHEEIAGKLCEAGADFGSAFDYAAEGKKLGTIRVLAKRLSQREPVSYADVSTEAKSAVGCANVSPLLLADSGKLKRALVCAAEEEDTTTVEYLLDVGAGVDAGDAVHAVLGSGTFTSRVILNKILGDKLGCTAVGARGSDGKLPLHGNIGVEVADILLEKGAPVDARVNRRTALYEHLVKGRYDVAMKLLAWKADVNAKCNENRTPVFAAAISSWRSGGLQILEKIVNSGGDVRVKDSRMSTPLHYASTTAIIEFLVSAGVDVNAKEDAHRGKGGGTALHKASKNLQYARVEALLAEKADKTIRDSNGKTPLEVVGESPKVAPHNRANIRRIKMLLEEQRVKKRARFNPPGAGASAGHGCC